MDAQDGQDWIHALRDAGSHHHPTHTIPFILCIHANLLV